MKITIEMIIDETIVGVLIDMMRIIRRTTNGIVEIILIGITHSDEITITNKYNPIGKVVIRTTEGPITIEDMMIIDHQIIDLMTTRSRKGLSNFNMIPETGIILNLRMLVELNMNSENLVAHHFQIATYAKKMGTMQINAQRKIMERHQQ